MKRFSGLMEMILEIWGPDAVPYTPTACEQIAALPSEEILVRASDKPATLPDALLRAANRSLETAPEELLHPTENKTL